MDRYGTAPAHVDPAREDSAVLEDPKTGHPEKLEIGQNNQGWGEVVIDNKEATPPPLAKAARAKPSGGSSPFSVATAQAAESEEQTGGLGLALGDGALAVETPKGKYVSDDAQAEVGRPVRIRARLSSDHDTGRNETVILMDGDRVIGTQVVRGVPDDGGGEAEFRWIPTKKGEHRLEVRTAAAIGVKDNSEPLDVDVVPVGEVEEPGGADDLWWKILLGVVLLGGVALEWSSRCAAGATPRRPGEHVAQRPVGAAADVPPPATTSSTASPTTRQDVLTVWKSFGIDGRHGGRGLRLAGGPPAALRQPRAARVDRLRRRGGAACRGGRGDDHAQGRGPRRSSPTTWSRRSRTCRVRSDEEAELDEEGVHPRPDGHGHPRWYP